MRTHGLQFKRGQQADHVKKTSPRIDNLVENQVLVYCNANKKDCYNILALFHSHVVRSKLSDSTRLFTSVSKCIMMLDFYFHSGHSNVPIHHRPTCMASCTYTYGIPYISTLIASFCMHCQPIIKDYRNKALSMHCVPMVLGKTHILEFKVVIITLSLCEFACEATTVRQAFNSNTPADKIKENHEVVHHHHYC